MPAKAAPKTVAKPAAPKAAAKPAVAKPAAAAPKAAAPKAAAPKAAVGNGIYVKGLGEADAATISALFEAKCGKVTNVQVRKGKYAQVFFDNAASVKKATETFNNKEVKGNLVTVSAAKSGPKAVAAEAKTVFVSPIFAASTTRKQVFALFAGCGKVIRLRTYHNNSAFVYFESAAAAQKAIKDKNGTEYQNKKLLVKGSVRTVEADKAAQVKREHTIKVRKHQSENRN
jgi:hypothetical protein